MTNPRTIDDASALADPHERLIANIRVQAHGCRQSGAPFYGDLFDLIARDVVDRGRWWTALEPYAAELFPTVRPLRVVGLLHRLALTAAVTGLTRHFPSTGGDGDAVAMWPAVLQVLDERAAAVVAALQRPVQTNEVSRSVALVGGFLWLAREFGLPLSLREIGSSGGLNLRVDRYYYEQDGHGWGDPSSPVRFIDQFHDGGPPFAAPLQIADRRGCDLYPVDATSDEGAITLLGFVWPEQTERLESLRSALKVARSLPVTVDAADAAEWVAREVSDRGAGTTTVVYHSVVWQYLPDATRDAIADAVARAGESAVRQAPLAWLRLEPPAGLQSPIELRVTTWPGGESRHLANTGMHRQPVRWLA